MISIIVAVCMTLAAGAEEPPTPAELAAITERGRNLAGYDRAAWHASDAIRAKPPQPGSVTGYIARQTDKGWTVAFGRLAGDRATYLVAAEATPGDDPTQFTVAAFDPPKVEAGFLPAAARAIETGVRDFSEHFEGEQRPYNAAVLPAEQGKFWVYLVPAPTKPGRWPLGGDVRYLVAADGTTIEAKRPLHKAIIENEPPKPEGQQQVAGIHTHVLAAIPEDTDVFYVLSRKPAIPEIIVTEPFAFVIEPSGAAKYLGKAKDVFPPK